MSKYNISCNCTMAVLFFASCSLVQTELEPSRTHNPWQGLCLDLDVTHSDSVGGHEFWITLVDKDGQDKQCYEKSEDYYIKMNTSAPTIKGLLIVQDARKKFGTFGSLSQKNYPTGLKPGLCNNYNMKSVSHKCDDETPCSLALTQTVEIPYTSPTTDVPTIEFRYSVVFAYDNYLQNKNVKFHQCSQEPVTEAPPVVCNATQFKKNHTAGPTERHCGNEIKYLNTTLHEEGNMTYDCIYKDKDNRDGIKQVQCGNGCLEESTEKLLCCRVKVMAMVSKTFQCSPRDGGPSMMINLKRERRSRCECFYCEEICSAEGPSPTPEPNTVNNHPEASQTNEVESHGTK